MYNSLITNFVTKKDWIMRSTFKVLFYVNGSKEKNGIVPIMGRVGKSSVSCPLKPSDSAPLKHSTMPP
jgi:hypothetical protein